jgi:hypothetical protein
MPSAPGSSTQNAQAMLLNSRTETYGRTRGMEGHDRVARAQTAGPPVADVTPGRGWRAQCRLPPRVHA